jgi:hypothetical protein
VTQSGGDAGGGGGGGGGGGRWSKHVPRCMEPHRGRSLWSPSLSVSRGSINTGEMTASSGVGEGGTDDQGRDDYMAGTFFLVRKAQKSFRSSGFYSLASQEEPSSRAMNIVEKQKLCISPAK